MTMPPLLELYKNVSPIRVCEEFIIMECEGLIGGIETRQACLVAWRAAVRREYEAKTFFGRRAVSAFKQCACWSDIFSAFGSLHVVSATVEEAEDLADVYILYENILRDIFSGKIIVPPS